MADLQFTVFYNASVTGTGPVLQEDTITIGGTSTQGAVITADQSRARKVRITADADCWVTWGSDPTAAADGESGRMFHSGQVEYFEILSGDRIAVIERV